MHELYFQLFTKVRVIRASKERFKKSTQWPLFMYGVQWIKSFYEETVPLKV